MSSRCAAWKRARCARPGASVYYREEDSKGCCMPIPSSSQGGATQTSCRRTGSSAFLLQHIKGERDSFPSARVFFVLAATGLLDGRRATTHWKYVDKLRCAFPLIQLQPDVLYVDDGDILTSAGSAAGIDLCLHIIRNDFGTLVANKVARRLVVSPHREGGQAQFIDKPIGDLTSPWLAHLLEWVQFRLHNSITVDQLASQAHMSKRTLSRRFAETTGSSPLDWITSLRVRRAKDLLEATTLSVEEVADRCGFGSAPTLRHHFRTRVKLTPNSYRARFQRSAIGH